MDEKKYPQIGPTGNGSELEEKVSCGVRFPKQENWTIEEALAKIKESEFNKFDQAYLGAHNAGVEASSALNMLSIKQKHEKLKAQSQTRETENFKRVGDCILVKGGSGYEKEFFKGAKFTMQMRRISGGPMNGTYETENSLHVNGEYFGSGTVEELLGILQ